VLFVAFGLIPLDAAYRAVDWNTILLLFGMMILNVNLRIAGFFHLVNSHVIRFARTPRRLLALIVFVSGVLSAIFLNDTIVLVFTPLVLDLTTSLKRNPLPYLVGLVTAANIGSVATITGNPQNMLVGISSGISFVDFTRALGPIAVLGLAIGWAVIVLVYRSEFRATKFAEPLELPPQQYRPLLRKSMVATGLMLVALICEGGQKVPASRLADMLWPDAEGDKALQNLKVALHRLRRLGCREGDEPVNWVHVKQGRVSLVRGLCWVDVLEG